MQRLALACAALLALTATPAGALASDHGAKNAAAMPAPDPLEARMKQQAHAMLARCGIGRHAVSANYDAQLQEYAFTVAGDGASFTDAELICVAERGGAIAYSLHFDDEAVAARLRRLLDAANQHRAMASARQWLAKRGLLARLPLFDRNHSRLEDFARKLEALCHVAPGAGLSVYGGRDLALNISRDGNINRVGKQQQPSLDQFACLMNAAIASSLADPSVGFGFGFGFVGNEAYSVKDGKTKGDAH